MTLAFSQFQTDTRSGAPARRARLFGSLAARGRRLKCKRPPSGEDCGEAERGSGIGLKLFGFIPESVFTFIPERYSGSSRNAVRNHPGVAFTLDRNPRLSLIAYNLGSLWPRLALPPSHFKRVGLKGHDTLNKNHWSPKHKFWSALLWGY